MLKTKPVLTTTGSWHHLDFPWRTASYRCSFLTSKAAVSAEIELTGFVVEHEPFEAQKAAYSVGSKFGSLKARLCALLCQAQRGVEKHPSDVAG